MRKVIYIALAVAAVASCAPKEKTLKSALEGKFLIGAAINEQEIRGISEQADSVLFRHFNAISPENCLKSGEVLPEYGGEYNWELADAYVQFGEDHNLWTLGHCLVWHSQLTKGFCTDEEGNLVDAETLKARMKDHITTIVTRYKGKIDGWDVVNEAIMEDGSYRESQFYQILGKEFIPWAFECAHEADPDVELYYNDYNMHEPGKRATVVELIRDLKARGLRIDAVGMQSHVGMDYPDFDEYKASMDAFIAEGVDVAITEWDMSALPTITMSADVSQNMGALFRFRFFPGQPQKELTEEEKAELDKALADFDAEFNPYKEGLPEEISAAWNARMKQFMDLYIEKADHISRVTAWGITDATSWKNGFMSPVLRTDYPLLFGRDYQAKPFIQELIDNSK